MSELAAHIFPDLSPLSPLGERWEALVRGNLASGFMQSLHWAEVKKRQGLTSFHIGITENDQLIGGSIFYTSKKRNGVGHGLRILIAPEGPVLPWDNESLATRALRHIIDTTQLHANEFGVMSMRIEPRLSPPPLPVLREFGRAPSDLVPSDTLYIDLSLSADNLLGNMKPKGRYNLGLAQRYGVEVKEDNTSNAIQRFYAVMQEAGSRDEFAVEPLSFFEHLVQVLSPVGCAKLLFAEHEGDTLGTLLLITYGSRATYLYGGITNKKRNLMGGYALQWTAMNMAKAADCTTYDFYGYDPFRAPEHRYSRFSQFKSQFGGSIIKLIGAQDYFFLDNVADAFIKVVNQIKDPITVQNQGLIHSV